MLLHLYSYLFHFVLGMFLFGISTIGWISQSKNFDLGVLPWSGPKLVTIVMVASLIGLVALVLAVSGKFRPLFGVWTLVVLCAMVYGFFLSSYSYTGMDHFKSALGLTAGALVAFIGGYHQTRAAKKRGY